MDVTGMGAGAGTRTEEVYQADLKDLLARAHRTRSRHRPSQHRRQTMAPERAVVGSSQRIAHSAA